MEFNLDPSKLNINTETAEQKAAREANEAEQLRLKQEEEARKAAGGGQGDEGNKGDEGNANEDWQKFETAVITKYPNTKFDDNDNLVDATGKVVKTAQEIETEFSNLLPAPAVEYAEKLKDVFGFELTDDKGQPIKIGNDVNKVFEVTQQVLPLLQQQAINSFLTRVPGLSDVAQHLASGGKIEDFKPRVDYSKVEIEEKNNEQHISIITERYVRSGMSEAEAKKVAVALAASDNSLELAKQAKQAIIDDDTKKAKQREEADKAAREADKQAFLAYYNERLEIVNKGEIKSKAATFKVDDTKKAAFMDYISKPVKNGYTQSELDLAALDPADELFIQYALFNKLNLGDVVKQLAQQSQVGSLRNRFTGSRGEQQSNPVKPVASNQLPTLDLSRMKIG